MSYIGKNPAVNFINLKPLAADPSNPKEGDIFYSDGTSRLEGPWVYQNGTWSQFSTGAAITIVDNLTLTPQSADPSSPTTGMLFYSDGTSRAEGIWFYTGTGWAQITGLRYVEFKLKTPVTCRVATTVNITLASQLEQGDTIDGVVLVAGDRVLVKNQTTASENGVYIVATSGAPTRASDADSASELTDYCAYIQFGTLNKNTMLFQNNVLSSLSDAQSWSASPSTITFTVPQDVYEIKAEINGSGGGGGGSVSNSTAFYAAGGGGGGSVSFDVLLKVSPADAISLTLGRGGLGGQSFFANTAVAANGGKGTSTILTHSAFTLTIPGADGGIGGSMSGSSPTPGTGAVTVSTRLPLVYTNGGNGGANNSSTTAAQSTIWADAGTSGGGNYRSGPGGAGRKAGANQTLQGIGNGNSPEVDSGAGASGCPYMGTGNTIANYYGGYGGSAYVRFSW